jgi:uncharacterized protein with NRDE domain
MVPQPFWAVCIVQLQLRSDLSYHSRVCTILVLRGVRADFPLIVATNRDEFYARETAGPGVLLEHPRTVGGRDLRAGGTWMGVTREGLFVGVTNHRSLEQVNVAALRSRGELVLHALALGSADAVSEYARSLDGREYNGFNLMWGDAATLQVAYGRPSERVLSVYDVPPGLHVLPNDELDSPAFAKVQRARQLVEPFVQAALPALRERLERALADRLLPALEDQPKPPPTSQFDHALLRELAALCVRTPTYGTRSSTIVLLEPGKVGGFFYADGPPDQTPFADITSLFEAD